MSEADDEPMETPGNEWGFEGGQMGKKYSTEELVQIIKNGMLFVEGSKAIIAKLRAGDKLCEAAKGLGWMITVYPHIDLSELDKAITDYEGKK